MAFDWLRAFDVSSDGLQIEEMIHIGGGTDSPIGNDAPIGSIYFRTNGERWKKFGGTANDWRIEPQAFEVPVDDTNLPYSANNVQEALENTSGQFEFFSSPGFTWGKNGTANSGQYLYNDDVPSNKSGRLVPFNGTITDFFVNNTRKTGIKELELRKRSPCQTGSWTTIETISIPNNEYCIAEAVDVDVFLGEELSVRIKPGSSAFKDPIVGVVIKRQ